MLSLSAVLNVTVQQTQHFAGGTQHFWGEAHSDTACPWCQLTYSISWYQPYFTSMLFAFFSNAHLNKAFPLSSLSNALIQEIKGTLENSLVILSSLQELSTQF